MEAQRNTRPGRYLGKFRIWIASIAASTLMSPLAVPAAEGGYVHFNWEEVAQGVWVGVSAPNSYQLGNVTIISLPGQGSLVVDSLLSESLGREIVEKVKQVGAGPVRYLVNTHLHQDHVGGNIALRKAFPKVEIIAHRATCSGIAEQTVPRLRAREPGMNAQLAQMKAKRESLAAGDPEAAVLDRRIAGTEIYLQDAKSFEWALPTTCLDFKPGQMRTITAGGRRVEIRHIGAGHSAGDLVVYLPKEKIVIAGDLWSEGGDVLLNNGIDGRDGSVLDAPQTMKQLRALDFNVVVPGHRAIIRDKVSLDAAIAFGDRFVAQLKEIWGRGEYVEDALRQMPPPSPAIATAWQRAVIRGFEEIDQRRQRGVRLP